MQIFTIDQLVEAYTQASEIKQMLFETLLSAGWNNFINLIPDTFAAVAAHNWNAVAVNAFVILCCLVFLYRLIFRNIWVFIKATIDN